MSASVKVFVDLWPAIAARVAEAVPEVEVVEVSTAPDDATAEVYFGGVKSGSANAAVLDRGVRWVALASTGIDLAPPEIFEHGRVVTCARGAAAIPISEFVLAGMLAFEKSVPEVWLDEPPEHWNLRELGTLHGRTVGIIGFGGIGQAVAHRSLAFGMRVLATRRSDTPSPIDGVELTDLDTVLTQADHLVLAAPATPDTLHLLDAAAFAKVRPGVHLVNIARGSLVDQDALRDALDHGRVAMATLDTVSPEPLPAGHWLYAHPKARVSAHVSWASPSGIDRTVDGFVANLRRYLADEPLEGVVDPHQRY